MVLLLIIEALFKGIILALGIVAVNGHQWAFICFIVLLVASIVFDVVLAFFSVKFKEEVGRVK